MEGPGVVDAPIVEEQAEEAPALETPASEEAPIMEDLLKAPSMQVLPVTEDVPIIAAPLAELPAAEESSVSEAPAASEEPCHAVHETAPLPEAPAVAVVWPSVGGRVKVWFDEVGAFIEGTVTKVSKPRSKKAGALGRLIVNYDDGDQGFCDYPEPGIEVLSDAEPGKSAAAAKNGRRAAAASEAPPAEENGARDSNEAERAPKRAKAKGAEVAEAKGAAESKPEDAKPPRAARKRVPDADLPIEDASGEEQAKRLARPTRVAKGKSAK